MRPEKESLANEIRGLLEGSGYAFLVDYRGLTVEQLTELRAILRDAEGRMTVVRNSFLEHAARALGWEISPGLLNGPTAVITGNGEVTQAAKILQDYRKGRELPVVKGGRLGGTELAAPDIEAMARIPPREVLLGSFVGTLAAPMVQLVGVMQQKVASLLYVLKAVEEKKQKESE